MLYLERYGLSASIEKLGLSKDTLTAIMRREKLRREKFISQITQSSTAKLRAKIRAKACAAGFEYLAEDIATAAVVKLFEGERVHTDTFVVEFLREEYGRISSARSKGSYAQTSLTHSGDGDGTEGEEIYGKEDAPNKIKPWAELIKSLDFNSNFERLLFLCVYYFEATWEEMGAVLDQDWQHLIHSMQCLREQLADKHDHIKEMAESNK